MTRRNLLRGTLAALAVATLPRVLLPKPSQKMLVAWDPAVDKDVLSYEVWYRPGNADGTVGDWQRWREVQIIEISKIMGVPEHVACPERFTATNRFAHGGPINPKPYIVGEPSS